MKRFLAIVFALCLVGATLLVAIPVSAENDSYPSWWPADRSGDSFERYHKSHSKHVVDYACIFDEELKKELNDRIDEIIDKTGIDLVIYTDRTDYNLGYEKIAEGFYVFNGYGLDEDYSGMILYICMERTNRGYWIANYGSLVNKYTPHVNGYFTEQLDNSLHKAAEQTGDYSAAMFEFLDTAEFFFEHGYSPIVLSDVLLVTVISLFVALIVGLICMVAAEKTMNRVDSHVNLADNYSVKSSLVVRGGSNTFLYRVRTSHPISRSSSSGGGGGSSYHGSHSSFGGSRSSGGGGHF